MPYTLKETPGGVSLEVAASGRDALVRESVRGVLDVLYGGSSAERSGSGQNIPIQAAGVGLGESLGDLVTGLATAALQSDGVLGAPVWLAFDEGRVTATLPVLDERRPVRALTVVDVRVEGTTAATFLFRAAPAAH
jgi:hypothetical protein